MNVNIFVLVLIISPTVILAFKSNVVLQHPILTEDYHSYLQKIYEQDGNLYGAKNNSNLGVCYGEDADWNDYPFIVEMRGGFPQCLCTGSIIDKGHRQIGAGNRPATILTAAHCEKCADEIYVGCKGANNCDGATVYRGNVSSFRTWNYEIPERFSNDIAIIQLDESAENNHGVIDTPSNAIAVTLNNNIFNNERVNRVTGYGLDATRNLPVSLQSGETHFVSNVDCNAAIDEVKIEANMICVQDTGNTNTPVTICSGDSGGPWTNYDATNDEFTQYGVTSFGLAALIGGCGQYECKCCPDYPQVGSNVGYFIGCICDRIGNNNPGCQIANLPQCPYN